MSSPPTPAEALQRQAHQLGLTAPQITALHDYQALLSKWNRVYNLTAVRDTEGMFSHHLLDSLAPVNALQRHLRKPSGRLLDVGSGAGLPGLVLAIALPMLDVVCVDTVGKKAAFMQQAIAELQLGNARAVHARVEALTDGGFDVITSRAFASLCDFARATRQLLAKGGVWMAMKGKHPTDEIAALPADIEVFHVEPLQVSGLDAERCLVWMRPRS